MSGVKGTVSGIEQGSIGQPEQRYAEAASALGELVTPREVAPDDLLDLPKQHVLEPSVEEAVIGTDTVVETAIVAPSGPPITEQQLGEAYERLSPYLRWLTRRIIGNTDLADEATQDTFERAVKSLRRGAKVAPEKLTPWIAVIATRRAYDVRRRATHFVMHSLSAPLGEDGETHSEHLPDLNAGDFDEQVLNREVINRALEGLPPSQQQMLLMRDVEGYTTDELAELFGLVSRDAVKTRLTRIRSAMRTHLRNSGVDGPW